MERWHMRRNIVWSAEERSSRKDQSPEATAFINACRSTEGNTVRSPEVIIEEDGVGFVCGKRDHVMYCEL